MKGTTPLYNETSNTTLTDNLSFQDDQLLVD